MTEPQIKEQIETIKRATEKALKSEEVARMFLDDPVIFPPQSKISAKKKVKFNVSGRRRKSQV